jgi:1,4-alpha-glucan branching enzyme
MMYAYSENFVLPLSHDEVVHGKGSLLNKIPGDRWQQMATLRTLYAYMWAHPGKQLIFMGQEFAQGAEWAESRSLDWWLLEAPDHRGVARLVTDLNRVYGVTSALWSQDTVPAGFHWIDANDAAGNVYSFLRFGTSGGTPANEGVAGSGGSMLACVANFSAVPHEGYRIGLPRAGRWDEIINTDAELYFGSGVGNFGGVEALDEPWHGQPASATLRVPPLGALWLRFNDAPEARP